MTWCALRESDAESLIQSLELQATDEKVDFPSAPINVVSLNSGWRVFWFNKQPKQIPKQFEVYSKDFDILYCEVEEHVMFSSAEWWSRGKNTWSISHNGEEGTICEDGTIILDYDGELPDCFQEIRTACETRQKQDTEVDHIFEIPLEVAKSICRFKHDEWNPEMLVGPISVFQSAAKPKGFLSRFFR